MLRFLLLVFTAASLFAQSIAITGATVFDGTGAEPRRATVLIRDGKITGVGANLAIPEGARVVQADGLALLPGLFDLHTHITAAGAPAGSRDVRADWLKNVKEYARDGITGVNEFGTYGETFEPYRKLLASLATPPRILFASRLSTPGGHGAEAGRGTDFSYEVVTPRQGRAAVQKALTYRPDVIKVFTDGWRYGAAPDMTSMNEPTLAAICEEAHKHNLPVLTHTVTLARAKIAARAGVDVIAHGVGDAPVDAELIALMKEHRTSYASTLAVYEPGPANPGTARAERWRRLLPNVAAMRDGGVTFVVGTDGGEASTPHGVSTLHELELLVQGGLTPTQALIAATRNSAAAMHATDRGTIAEGKIADLLLVEGEPWRTISDIRNTRRVWIGGREVDREALKREIDAPGPTPIAATKATKLIDDFEKPERSSLDTLRLTNTDSGHDHAQLLFAQTWRRRYTIFRSGSHALTLIGQMTDKDNPFARVVIPLNRGAVVPVDASAFHGIRFDSRGGGEYKLIVTTRTETWTATFHCIPEWKNLRIPFAALASSRNPKWTGDNLLWIAFELSRPAGEKIWLELDNVRFF
ncbi:MAG TPA: amidohydrolase family protein [Bryobacteraceae bacterium]|nr:amidohydrolase family protein [Bryobacteraceae bacterium]